MTPEEREASMLRRRMAARKMKEEIDRNLKEAPKPTPEECERRFRASVRRLVELACEELHASAEQMRRDERWQAEEDRKRGSKGPKLTVKRMQELVAAWSDNPSASSNLARLCNADWTSDNATTGA